ncbi:hypothetical protein F7725_022704, partial [Dissostichus mawsoni]
MYLGSLGGSLQDERSDTLLVAVLVHDDERPVQRDGLVQDREGASLLQELVQLQALRQPEGVLLRAHGPLHRKPLISSSVWHLLAMFLNSSGYRVSLCSGATNRSRSCSLRHCSFLSHHWGGERERERLQEGGPASLCDLKRVLDDAEEVVQETKAHLRQETFSV